MLTQVNCTVAQTTVIMVKGSLLRIAQKSSLSKLHRVNVEGGNEPRSAKRQYFSSLIEIVRLTREGQPDKNDDSKFE